MTGRGDSLQVKLAGPLDQGEIGFERNSQGGGRPLGRDAGLLEPPGKPKAPGVIQVKADDRVVGRAKQDLLRIVAQNLDCFDLHVRGEARHPWAASNRHPTSQR